MFLIVTFLLSLLVLDRYFYFYLVMKMYSNYSAISNNIGNNDDCWWKSASAI